MTKSASSIATDSNATSKSPAVGSKDSSNSEKNDTLQRLQKLNLINRIAHELDTQMNLSSDRTLAEFVISLAEQILVTKSKSSKDKIAPLKDPQFDADIAKEFQKTLSENGASNAPLSLSSFIIQQVYEMSPRIQKIKEKQLKKLKKKKKSEEKKASKEKRLLSDVERKSTKEIDSQFPGLAMRNLASNVPLEDGFYEHNKDDVENKQDGHSSINNSKKRRWDDDNDNYKDNNRDNDRKHQAVGETSQRRGVSNLPSWMTKGDHKMDPPPPRNSDELQLYNIYTGRITKMTDFGAFVKFEGIRNVKKEGLIHLSQISKTQRISRPSEVFRPNQQVYCKVISLKGENIMLSAKDVDQKTGKDLAPYRGATSTPSHMSTTKQPSSSMSNNYNRSSSQQKKSSYIQPISDHELFEAQQLIHSSVLPIDQYPTFSSDPTKFEETEEETEVELADFEPAFLKGQTRRSGRDIEPIRIIKNPDGSLSRAAMQQGTLAKERRELRQAQQNQLMDSIPKDLNRPWEDPMPEAGERHFAMELRSINISNFDGAPEWKQKVENKTLSYGIISNKSVKDQREDLPIYRLKTELKRAIHENQVLVVIG